MHNLHAGKILKKDRIKAGIRKQRIYQPLSLSDPMQEAPAKPSRVKVPSAKLQQSAQEDEEVKAVLPPPAAAKGKAAGRKKQPVKAKVESEEEQESEKEEEEEEKEKEKPAGRKRKAPAPKAAATKKPAATARHSTRAPMPKKEVYAAGMGQV